jgi:hypothetical protein
MIGSLPIIGVAHVGILEVVNVVNNESKSNGLGITVCYCSAFCTCYIESVQLIRLIR